MPSVARLPDRDLHAALSIVAEAAGIHGAQPFAAPTIESLLRVIPADRAGYYEYSRGGVAFGSANTFFVDAPSLRQDLPWDSDAVRGAIASWPLRDCDAVQDSPLKLSDLLTRAQLRRNAWYSEIMRPSLEHELKVWLPAAPGTYRGFFFVRGPRTRDFDERDRALLALLQPHLARIRAGWERRRPPAVLTTREAEVLELVALGLTNAEIATRLVVSPATVRTHLENVFEKLDVHTRTAAVARLRDPMPRG